MADTFGLKIGVEGEKEFKKSLTEINNTFKVLGSEMKLATSQFDGNEKSVESLTAKNQVLGKQIDAQKGKISTLRSALENAADSFGENDKRTQKWQIALNNAEAELNGMERELKQNESAVDDMGNEMNDARKQTDKFGEELDDTGKQADSSGGHFEKLSSVVKGVATAVGAAMATIGAAAVKAGKEIYDMVGDVAATGDNIDKMSQRLGLSTEAYQEWEYVLSQSGVDIDSVSTGMKKLTNSIDDAKNGSDTAIAQFEKLGITTDDLANKSREDIFAMTVQGLQQMIDDTQKAALANDVFGKSGQEILPLLNQSAESTQALIDKSHEMGMVLSDESVGAAVAYTDSLDTLQRTFSGVKNQISSELLPGFTMIMDGLSALLTGQEGATEQLQAGAMEVVTCLSDIFPQIMDIFIVLVSAIAEVAPNIIVAIITGITDNLDSLVEAASNIMLTLLTALIEALPQLTEGALQLVLTLVNGILENLPQLVEAALQMVVTLALGIAEALPELIPTIVQTIVFIVETLLSNLDMILDCALQLITGLAQGLLDAIPVIIDALPEIITSIITFILDSIPQIINAGIELLIALIDALPQIITTIVNAIPQIISGIVNGLLGNLDKIINAGVQLFVAIIKNLPKIIVEIVKAVPQIITGLVKAFGSLVGEMATIGGNIVKGLWDGITGLASWLWDKVSGWISDIWDGICDFFGIHSPSREMAWVGQMLVKGLSGSIEDNGGEAVKAAEDMSREIDGVMTDLAEDMQTALPTEFSFDVNTDTARQSLNKAMSDMADDVGNPTTDVNLSGRNGGADNSSVIVSVPLYMDGKQLTTATSTIQSGRNGSYRRALGVI